MGVILVETLDGSTADGPIYLDAPAETSADVVRTGSALCRSHRAVD